MGEKIFRIVSGLIALIVVLVVAFPFVVMLSISLQSRAELFSTSASLIPEKWMFSNYVEAFKSANWGRYFLNSFVITAVVTVVSLVINSMAGYVFARIRFRFSKVLFLVILAGMMIPPQVTMIPVFSMLRGFPLVNGNDILGNGGSGLINTYAGMILPFIAGSFGVFLCRQYYVGFPRELDDAATVDGCGRVRAFFRIYLPLSKPVLASLGVLKFTGTWNEYTWPLIMARSDSMKTVQVALTLFRNESEIRWNLMMAATIMISLAVYIVFGCAQKHFVNGILAGSIKG
ncbi:MAG: carbohydrate ABC transporter permease [Ruminococcaceae bacterium]|nr:carbohydrate ABC transporter permease [Oscillospiraceae bacterium]